MELSLQIHRLQFTHALQSKPFMAVPSTNPRYILKTLGLHWHDIPGDGFCAYYCIQNMLAATVPDLIQPAYHLSGPPLAKWILDNTIRKYCSWTAIKFDNPK